MYCKNCGVKLVDGVKFCPECGTKVEDSIVVNVSTSNQIVESITKKCNKWVSFVLCLFFGFLGAHKFYEGHIGKGILYLFTAGLLGIGWFFDTISILLKPHYYYTVRG